MFKHWQSAGTIGRSVEDRLRSINYAELTAERRITVIRTPARWPPARGRHRSPRPPPANTMPFLARPPDAVTIPGGAQHMSTAVNSCNEAPASRSQWMLANLRRDVPASLVVFLVALSSSLGIAIASGAPIMPV